MSCDSPLMVESKLKGRVPVPCGRCPNCKKRRVATWAFRLMQEERVSLSSFFLTLTYDTIHVPITPKGFMTTAQDDIQKFWKRLRKLQTEKIKYYAVSEYGSKSNRPHYHAIVFGVVDSELFNKAWQKGTIHVGQVSEASIRYTLKYIDKPGRIPMFKGDDREPERAWMSKGLGANYLSPEIVRYHKLHLDKFYVRALDGVKVPLPRYYREKMFTDSERWRQNGIVQSMVEENERKREQEFNRSCLNEEDYVNWLSKRRIADYEKFYSKQKERDL